MDHQRIVGACKEWIFCDIDSNSIQRSRKFFLLACRVTHVQSLIRHTRGTTNIPASQRIAGTWKESWAVGRSGQLTTDGRTLTINRARQMSSVCLLCCCLCEWRHLLGMQHFFSRSLPPRPPVSTNVFCPPVSPTYRAETFEISCLFYKVINSFL